MRGAFPVRLGAGGSVTLISCAELLMPKNKAPSRGRVLGDDETLNSSGSARVHAWLAAGLGSGSLPAWMVCWLLQWLAAWLADWLAG